MTILGLHCDLHLALQIWVTNRARYLGSCWGWDRWRAVMWFLKRTVKAGEKIMSKNTQTKIIYVDMDNTLCDFTTAYLRHRVDYPEIDFPHSIPEFFQNLAPLPNAIRTFEWLSEQPDFEVYILTAPSVKNPLCYTEKRLWVEKYLGFAAVNQLIISPHKNLNKGHYLIDDNVSGKGQENFEGEVVQFRSELFPDWAAIHLYFKTKIDSGEFIKFPESIHPDILCFRSFDLRDRFSEPVATFREALELLQSERAYLPEMSSNIICYLKNGQSIPIPEIFYLEERLQFESREGAQDWVLQRQADAQEEGNHFKGLYGLIIADPKLPIDEQIESAANNKLTEVIKPSENDRVCADLATWLNSAIGGMLSVDDERQALIETLKSQDHEELVAFFKEKEADQTNPARWVISSRDYGLTAISGNAYFDIVNHFWTPEISDASCIKEVKIAEAVVESFGTDVLVEVVQHFISQKELTKAAIKLESNPKVIIYNQETDIYLYEEHNPFSESSSQAVLTLHNPEQYVIDRNVVGIEQLTVNIPNAAMDEVSIAWCKHRNLQGALGGPVGKEWGSSDCDYDWKKS